MTTQSSFSISGFWFHVTWNAKGTIGIDQHGTTWFNKSNPISESGMSAEKKQKKGWISADDLFMETRENPFYINRTYSYRNY
jgi:hypothetical protein